MRMTSSSPGWRACVRAVQTKLALRNRQDPANFDDGERAEAPRRKHTLQTHIRQMATDTIKWLTRHEASPYQMRPLGPRTRIEHCEWCGVLGLACGALHLIDGVCFCVDFQMLSSTTAKWHCNAHEQKRSDALVACSDNNLTV